MSKSSISLKGTMTPNAFALLLDDLAKSVRKGTVCLQKGAEFVTLKPAGNMEFKVEAAVKKGKQQLCVSMKWEEPCEVASSEEIKITSVEPEIPVDEPKPSTETAIDKKAVEQPEGAPVKQDAKDSEKKVSKQK